MIFAIIIIGVFFFVVIGASIYQGIKGKKIIKQIKANEEKPDLYIHEGNVGFRLNTKKLEECINKGTDNEYIRKAKREKKMIDKIDSSESIVKNKIESLLEQTRIESNKWNILRTDNPKTKEIKKANKEKVWAEYHKKKEEINSIKYDAFIIAYGEKFFADLMADEDAIGWEWCLRQGSNIPCELCKKNAGKYRKGTGPKFPAHAGCSCLLEPVYSGEI